MDATVQNMRRLEAAGIAAVMVNPVTGEMYSATPGDYFWAAGDQSVDPDCVLARRIPERYEEITEGDLG